MAGYDPAEWTDLFVATAGAGAALAGLVFVAVSINVERILKLAGMPERAVASLLLLLGVVVISLVGLAPGQSPSVVAGELLGVGLVGAIATTILVLKHHGSHARPILNVGVMLAGTLPFALAGLSMIAGAGGGLYWVLAGIVLAIIGAVLNAWVLLVEILR